MGLLPLPPGPHCAEKEAGSWWGGGSAHIRLAPPGCRLHGWDIPLLSVLWIPEDHYQVRTPKSSLLSGPNILPPGCVPKEGFLLSTTNWHLLGALASYLPGLDHVVLQLLTSSTPKGAQGGEQK